MLSRLLSLLVLLAVGSWSHAQGADGPVPRSDSIPDLRQADLPASARKGNFVAVPIPFSNPLFDVGVIGAVGYFHPQTEAQQETQPASVTGLGVMYTNNDSYGIAVGHSGYWKGDLWRFKGGIGHADAELPLLSADESGGTAEIDWLIAGSALFAELSRRVAGRWYAGVTTRYVDMNQTFEIGLLSRDFALMDSGRTGGLGASMVFDTRDKPTNAYEGRYFRTTAFFNRRSLGSDDDYDSYSVAYRSYHALTPVLVLAWEASGCLRSGTTPLWDACSIGLRGFAATDYLGKSTVRAQVEARWQFAERWGLAGFVGAGQVARSLTGLRNHDTIPSYGVGVRFMVSKAERINMRVDYARSTQSDAVHLWVGEAF